jgi:hypothetical protein
MGSASDDDPWLASARSRKVMNRIVNGLVAD